MIRFVIKEDGLLKGSGVYVKIEKRWPVAVLVKWPWFWGRVGFYWRWWPKRDLSTVSEWREYHMQSRALEARFMVAPPGRPRCPSCFGPIPCSEHEVF